MREIQIDRDDDGNPTRMRFGGDDLAGPFPARRQLREHEPCEHPGCLHHVSHPCEGCGRTAGRYVAEVVRPRYVLAPDADGKPALWHRHSVERDRDFGGSVGLCLSVRRGGTSEWTWIQAATVTAEFHGRREADEALVQAQHDALPFWASTGGAE